MMTTHRIAALSQNINHTFTKQIFRVLKCIWNNYTIFYRFLQYGLDILRTKFIKSKTPTQPIFMAMPVFFDYFISDGVSYFLLPCVSAA